MNEALAYVQNQILDFSMEGQLYLLAYIANNVNKKNSANQSQKVFTRKARIGKAPDFYMSPDFDEPLDDFAPCSDFLMNIRRRERETYCSDSAPPYPRFL